MDAHLRNRFEKILADLLWGENERPNGYELGDLFIIPKDEMKETLYDFNEYINGSGDGEYCNMTEMYFIPYKGSLVFLMANEIDENTDDVGIYPNEFNAFGSVITSFGAYETSHCTSDISWDKLEGMVKCFVNHKTTLKKDRLLCNESCIQLIEIVNEMVNNIPDGFSFVDNFIDGYDDVKTGRFKELKSISIDIETDGLMLLSAPSNLFAEIPSPQLPESKGNKLFSI